MKAVEEFESYGEVECSEWHKDDRVFLWIVGTASAILILAGFFVSDQKASLSLLVVGFVLLSFLPLYYYSWQVRVFYWGGSPVDRLNIDQQFLEEKWNENRHIKEINFDRVLFWGKLRGRFVIGMFSATIVDESGSEYEAYLFAHYCYYRRVNMPDKHSWQPLDVAVPQDQGNVFDMASELTDIVLECSSETERNGIIERFPDPFSMKKMKKYFLAINDR